MERLVNEGIITRKAGRGTYVEPERLSRVSYQVKENIGLVICTGEQLGIWNNELYGPMVNICEKWVRKEKKHLLFYNTEKKSDDFRSFLHKVDGVLLLGEWNSRNTKKRRKILEELKFNGVPVVAINGHVSEQGICSVVPDNEKGAFMATEHLLNLGHRCIVYFAGEEDSYSDSLRYATFLRALENRGISFNSHLFFRGYFSSLKSVEPAKKILEKKKEFSAVFAANDKMALTLMRMAQEKGIKIPDEFSLVGFDDIEAASEAIPPLTTVLMNREKLAQQAVKLLSKLLKREEISNLKAVVPVELKVRGTTKKYGKKQGRPVNLRRSE